MPSIVEQLRDLVELFGDVATTDPIAPLLLAAGVVLLGFSVAVVGFLSIGAVLQAMGAPLE